MKFTTEIIKNYNNRLVFFLLLLAVLNQIKFLFPNYEFFYYAYVGIFACYLSLIFYKKKIQSNKIKYYFPLLMMMILFFFEYIIYNSRFDLKIFILLNLVMALCFLICEFSERKFFLGIIYTSLFFFILGSYGWLDGGQGGIWGKQFVYFGYHYLESTRNEDALIFFYGFLLSLFYIFFYRLDWKILIINQLNLLALLLSFSRGFYLITIFNFILILLFIIFIRKDKLKEFLIYIIICLIVSFSSFQLLNNTVKVDMNKIFIIKVFSLYNFVLKKEIMINEESEYDKTHLYKTSVKSLTFKVDDWSSFVQEITNNKIIFNNLIYKNDEKNYTESSLLYFLKELNIIIFILLCYFFILQIYQVYKKKENNEQKLIFSIVLINFILLNSIYNYLDDIWNYLIFLYLALPLSKKLIIFKI